MIVRGYRDAVRRLVGADRTSDGDAVHIALTEATNWLDSLAEQTPVRSDTHVQAVLFARQRSHHQWGAITYRDDAGVYRWRPAGQLPTPPDVKHKNPHGEKVYVQHLAGQAVLDVFRHIEPRLPGLITA